MTTRYNPGLARPLWPAEAAQARASSARHIGRLFLNKRFTASSTTSTSRASHSSYFPASRTIWPPRSLLLALSYVPSWSAHHASTALFTCPFISRVVFIDGWLLGGMSHNTNATENVVQIKQFHCVAHYRLVFSVRRDHQSNRVSTLLFPTLSVTRPSRQTI